MARDETKRQGDRSVGKGLKEEDGRGGEAGGYYRARKRNGAVSCTPPCPIKRVPDSGRTTPRSRL
jgi:hypothetical protein